MRCLFQILTVISRAAEYRLRYVITQLAVVAEHRLQAFRVRHRRKGSMGAIADESILCHDE